MAYNQYDYIKDYMYITGASSKGYITLLSVKEPFIDHKNSPMIVCPSLTTLKPWQHKS